MNTIINTTIVFALLFSSNQAASVSAEDCPCYMESDIAGDIHSFINGAVMNDDHSFVEETLYQLTTTYQRRFGARETKTTFGGFSNTLYTCTVALLEPDLESVATIQSTPINEQTYETCRDLLRFVTPSSSPQELEKFDRLLQAAAHESIAFTLENTWTGNYLTLNDEDDTIATTTNNNLGNTPLANHWTLQSVDCYNHNDSTAAQPAGQRQCFSLVNLDDPEVGLGTNGVQFFAQSAPVDILGALIVEPTICDRGYDACTVKLHVEFYNDGRAVADLPCGQDNNFLCVSQDDDKAEWILSRV